MFIFWVKNKNKDHDVLIDTVNKVNKLEEKDDVIKKDIDDILKLLFKTKPIDKIILISDALPITNSNLKEATFADSKIYYDGKKATSSNGTIAGSTMLLDGIISRLKKLDLYNPKYKNLFLYLWLYI